MKSFLTSFIIIMLSVSFIFVGCSNKKEEPKSLQNDQIYMNPNDDTLKADTTSRKSQDTVVPKTKKNSIIREGIIDVKSVDSNKDGSVYECQMDYNVISDNPGNCPVCKMELEKRTIAEVEENLAKNDYQVAR